MKQRTTGLRRAAPAALFFALAAVVMTYPLVLNLTDHVCGDASDPSYTMWVLSNNYRAAAGHGSLWTGNNFYPHTGTLYYGDPLFGLTLLGAPVRLLTSNPVLIYNVLYLFAFFFSGFGLYTLVRRLTGSGPAAVLAGFLFAYFPYSAAHVSHLELLYYGWIPIVLLFMHRFFEKPSWGNTVGMAVSYVLLVLTCVYYGEFFTLLAAGFAAFYAWRTGLWKTGRFWLRCAGFAALSAAVLVPYALPFVRLHQRMLFIRPMWEIRFFSAQIQHYGAVPFSNRLWGSILGGPGGDELKLYLGLVPMGLFLAFWIGALRKSELRLRPDPAVPVQHKHHWILWDGLNFAVLLSIVFLAVNQSFRTSILGVIISNRRLEDPVTFLLISLLLRITLDPPIRARYVRAIRSIGSDPRFYTAAALLAGLLTFGPEIRIFGQRLLAGPYAFLYRVLPGFSNFRVPARFVVLLMLGLLIVGACAFAGILNRSGKRKRVVLTALLLAVGAAEYISMPVPMSEVATAATLPGIYKTVAALPPAAVLIELPMPPRDNEEYKEAEAVYYSSFHRRRIVNGYSGSAPPGYRVVREAMQDFPSRRTFELLRALDVGYVLIHAGGRHAEKGSEMVRRLAVHSDRVVLQAAEGRDFLYRLLPTAAPPAGPAAGKPVGDRKLWKAEASRHRRSVEAAFDGDPDTFWTTGYPQSRGDFFTVDLGRVERFRQIDLKLQDNPLDFPRDFEVRISHDGTNWTLLDRVLGYFPMLSAARIEDFSSYRAVLSEIPAEARFIRIRLIESHPDRHWSIAELELRGD